MLIGSLAFVKCTPLKISKPQAVTAADLTDTQIKELIEKNPPRPSILRPDNGFDKFPIPSIPLYLPDPERNKTKDDFYMVPEDEQIVNTPVKLSLPLDSYGHVTNYNVNPIALKVEQADREKTSYSYNDRYDYYFPVQVVLDENRKYAEKELQMMELKPPALRSDDAEDEPNYYAVKPKKIPKKFQPNKKDVNINKSSSENVPQYIDNDGLVLSDDSSDFVTSYPVERFLPAPTYRKVSEDDLNTGEYILPHRQQFHDQKTEPISLIDSTVATKLEADASTKVQSRLEAGELNLNQSYFKLNPNDERVEFQMHGFNGPNSYKFGFDTGKG